MTTESHNGRSCRECGGLLEDRPNGRPRTFCDKDCRQKWHNRRIVRGGELYDFVMAWRYDRDTPDMMAQIARLASAYREADKALRDGRHSWNAEEAQMRLPLGFGTDGDGR